MQHLPIRRKLPEAQQRLLDLYNQLQPEDRRSLLAFAEFLCNRDRAQTGDDAKPQAIKHEPEQIPRPESESVIKAIKRLSASYHMLDRQAMLDETSSLMMSHVVQGRDAADVIDDQTLRFGKARIQ